MIDDWNKHMQGHEVEGVWVPGMFIPSGTVCLDESMVKHHNERIPGFMHVPRKPTPLGNEYHTICDAETRILFGIELVEGRSRPAGLGLPKYQDEHGATTSLILRMTECLRNTSTVVIMDSAFCVVKALAELLKRGIFAATVAKKRAYWPRHVPGDEVKAYMEGKPIGELHGRRGKLGDCTFHLFAVNHSRYTFLLLSTYGSLALVGPERTIFSPTNRSSFSYRRNEPIADYYRGRHAVDDHNHLRQGQRVDVERAWGSKFWHVKQLAFLVSATLVNTQLAYNHFVVPLNSRRRRLSFNQVRMRVAAALLMEWERNEADAGAASSPTGRRHLVRGGHMLVSYEKNRSFRNPAKKVKSMYLQRKCQGEGCKRMVRRHCTCDRTLSLCLECHNVHVAAMAAM
jgi:xylulokinase